MTSYEPTASTLGTVGGYEPRNGPVRRQAPRGGVECPECGSLRTPVITSGRDLEERVLRERKCEGCDTKFATIEQIIRYVGGDVTGQTVKFSDVDVRRRQIVREAVRRKHGWRGGTANGNRMRFREYRITGAPRVDGRRAQ